MGLWRVPQKVLLPAEPDGSPRVFEFNGRLAHGDQVMAYVGCRIGETAPSAIPYTRYTAVVLRFDADGVLLSCDFDSTAHGGDYLEKDADRSYRKARELLAGLVERVKAEGWESADIVVRPFYVVVDGLATGLVYRTDGEDEGEGPDCGPEEVRLVPFSITFRRPWDTGEYST